MSRIRGTEGEEDTDSSQNGHDSSGESSVEDVADDVVEGENKAEDDENKAEDEPVPKRQRLSAEAADPASSGPVNAGQSQRQDGLSLAAQQTLLRHLLNNGNQVQAMSAQDLAHAEINAQLRSILMQQQLLLNGGYFPPQLGSATRLSQSGTLDTLARLSSLPSINLGYLSASLGAAPLGPMHLLQQQVNTRLPDSIGSALSAGRPLGNFTSPPLAAYSPQLTGRPAVPLSIEADQRTLSEFQRLVRKHIELFEAIQEDVESNAQGRNRPIVLGQVGIRCCHCSHLPPKLRCRGATYYPTTLQGLYQAAQNMATGHLCKRCPHVPSELREELVRLKECKSSAGGGKTYWGDGVRSLGVFEAPNGLRFLPRSQM